MRKILHTGAVAMVFAASFLLRAQCAAAFTSKEQGVLDNAWLDMGVLVIGGAAIMVLGYHVVRTARRLRMKDSTLQQESSKRVKAEQALQHSQELISRIVQVHSEGMLVLSEEGTILFANPAAETLTGRSATSLEGFPFGFLAAREHEELDLLTQDGSRRVVEVRTEMLDWRGRQATLLCLRDVTESRLAEEKLRESKALLQSTFQSMKDLLVVLDKDHNILLSNWRGIEDQQELLAPDKPRCYEALFGQECACEDCPLQEVHLTGLSAEFERTDPQTGRIYQVRVSPIFDENDRVDRVVEHLRDITEERRAKDMLRESERNYRLLARNIPNAAVHMFNHNLEYVVSDGDILEALGLSDAFLKGKTIRDILPDNIAATLEPHYRAALRGERRTAEVELAGKVFEVRTLPMEDRGQGIIAGMVLSLDITQRKLAEARLRSSESRYRAVFDNAAVGVCTLDMQGKFIDVNHVYASMLGYAQEELFGMSILDVTFEEDRKRYETAFEQLVSGVAPRVFIEKENLRKDRSVVPVRVGLSLAPGHGQDKGYLVAVVEDITLRRRSEEELANYGRKLEAQVLERTSRLQHSLEQTRAAKNRIEAIVTSISEGVMVTDRDNCILLLNEQAENILGVKFVDTYCRQVTLVINRFSYKEKICRHIERAHETASYSFDFEVKDAAGKECIYQARTSAILNAAGAQDGVIIIMNDVTQERLVDRMKSQFISTAAHELRTPLTSIQGYTELLAARENLPPNAVVRYAGMANRMARQLSSIVNDLLDISRIESGKGFSFNLERTSVRDLIRNKVEVYSHRTDKHLLLTRFDSESGEAWVDAGRTEQVLENCISNAVKYSPQGGQICVSLVDDGDFLRVTVEDQGLGMNSEQLSRVFDHFYRAHDQNGKIQGTGLGMSIVKHIVEQQGGAVWLESEEGKGTAVHFTLPKKRMEADNSIQAHTADIWKKGEINA